MINKGFEVIEAMWLFGLPLYKIRVIIHPQSAIHSAVEFIDGTIIAQLGPADMRLPIQYALLYPGKRQHNIFRRFNFHDFSNLTFAQPNTTTFPCLRLALQAAQSGQSATAVLTATNDIAVNAFLAEQISFLQIPEIIEKTLAAHKIQRIKSLDQVWEIDDWARNYTRSLVK
ncbi:hypothetical protein M1563_04130 [Patescibacteria group bacterium]|nr:hypothetical protein [Patescibacteria group bacterium]